MMEQLAERRMQREEEAAADVEDDSEEDSEDEGDDGSDADDGDDGEGGSEDDEDEEDDDEEVSFCFLPSSCLCRVAIVSCGRLRAVSRFEQYAARDIRYSTSPSACSAGLFSHMRFHFISDRFR